MIDPKARLKKMIESGKIPHALLFCGPKEHLEEEAYNFASQAILSAHPEATSKLKAKNHPDIHFFRPEGRTGMHAMDGLRKLSQEVSLNCVEARSKFLIITDAERCLPTSSNALLKTLEEPVSHSVILLLTSKPEKLLPTICSRCQRVTFPSAFNYERTPYQNQFLKLLTEPILPKAVAMLCNEIESARKEWEKKMMKDLPKEMTALQRERLEKEIESTSALDYQEKAISLLETFFLWVRDIHFLHLGVSPHHLVHQDCLPALQKAPKLPLKQVEEAVSALKIAIERSTNLQSCLESLLVRFGFL